jgi:hypothetical protein
LTGEKRSLKTFVFDVVYAYLGVSFRLLCGRLKADRLFEVNQLFRVSLDLLFGIAELEFLNDFAFKEKEI